MDTPFAMSPNDALTQPTRARLFSLLREFKRPVGTVELAERVGLHPNGVRLHLERMEQAGLVVRARARQRRGRPPDTWAIAPGAQPGGYAPLAYRDLGRWLARAVGSGRRGMRGIEQTGREIGRELVQASTDSPSETFESSLSALGFQPSRKASPPKKETFSLGNCPYRDAVRENQPVVCALHRGITQGLLDSLAPQATLAAFVPHDPDQAGCTIEIRGLEAASRH
jgi:predicted ArsR family transcriptional regulator